MGNATGAKKFNDAEIHPIVQYGTHAHAGNLALMTVVMSTSYATGGDTVDLSAVFPTNILAAVVFNNGTANLPSYVAGAGPASGKVKCIIANTGVEVAATTDLSANTFYMLVWGN